MPTERGAGRETAPPTLAPGAWQAMLDALPGAVWLVDPHDLRVAAHNAEAGRFFGPSAAPAGGRPIGELFPSPEDACFWADVCAGRDDVIASDTLVLRKGEAVPVRRVVRRTGPAAGAGDWFVVSLHDRSDEVRHARGLERVVADLRATLESVHDGILVTDLAGRIRHFNTRFAAIWGLPGALLGGRGAAAGSGASSAALRDDDAVLEWMRRAVSDPEAYMRRLAAFDDAEWAEAVDLLPLRSGRVLERVTRPQQVGGRVVGRVATFRDITATPDARRRLEAISTTDALTGLPNQRLLEDRLEQSLAVARRDGTRFGLLYVNLDAFTLVDTALGRDGADRVLQEVAERVRHCMRRVDTVARLDADEFVVLVHQADAAGAETAAQRLMDALKLPVPERGASLVLTASIGIALCLQDGADLDALLQCAEAAMRVAKAAGGAAFHFGTRAAGG